MKVTCMTYLNAVNGVASCLSSSNAPFPLFSRTLDRIRTAQYETNDTHFLHELPISAPHEKLNDKNQFHSHTILFTLSTEPEVYCY